jgi:lipopolysaccharide/colanic/teichoic acid biosynthesis glycosyltransferase
MRPMHSCCRELRKQTVGLSRVARAAKRTLDFAVATMGLLILAPWLTLIAIAIKLDSRGPILFRQVRYDFNGRHFEVYKFRTTVIVDDATTGSRVPEVTKVGAVLRRSNMDELPELINVLRNEMSIVGPRPLGTIAGRQAYEHTDALWLKPGITGWAQVHGYRGALNSPEEVRRVVEHDLWYFRHWSILLDLRIIFLTLFSRRAYTSAI